MKKLFFICSIMAAICHSPFILASDYWKNHNCARSIPTPTLNAKILVGATYNLNKSDGKAIEQYQFPDGTKLTVTNWGCEYYALSYEFELHTIATDMNNTNFWMTTSAHMLANIEKANTGLANLTDVIRWLTNSDKTKNFIFGKEIDLNDESMREFFVIDKPVVEKNGNTILKIGYNIGPL